MNLKRERKQQLKKRNKKRAATEIDHSNIPSMDPDDSWREKTEIKGEKRIIKKRRLEKLLSKGERIEVYWGKEVAEEGYEGYYQGKIVGYPEDNERNSGDHLVLYDDCKDKGPIIERLFEEVGMVAEEWRLL